MEGLAFDKDISEAPVFMTSLAVAPDRFLVSPLFCFLALRSFSLQSGGYMNGGQDFHDKVITLIGKVRLHSARRKAKKGNTLYITPLKKENILIYTCDAVLV